MKRQNAIAVELVTQAEYARRRKVTRGYVNKLAKSGVLVMRDGKVDVKASDAVLDDRAKVAFEPEAASSGTGENLELTEAPKTYAAARFQREVFTGRLRRLEFEAKNGSLIPAAEVSMAWSKISESVKQRLTALPSKLAPVLAAISDEKQIRKAIEAEINAALRALAAEVRIGH